VQDLSILIVGGGIGGLTAAIAFRHRGFAVTLIEKDPAWSAYGVGIIQQGNVLRALNALGLLDHYVDAGAGFDFVEVYAPDGTKLARVPSPRLLKAYPANLGISRRALQKVLVEAASTAGAAIRLGTTVDAFEDRGEGVGVRSGRRGGRHLLPDSGPGISGGHGPGIHGSGGLALQPP
jgi:2-polyprenyl-6-methoxyphenol hydroxylase-like FAD-dependent oxidoreductase